MTTTKDCRDCKHHSTKKQPRVVDPTGFDDQIEFADDDETVYVCRASEGPYANGKEVGTLPVTCASWTAWTAWTKAGADRLAELDRMIAAQNERLRKRGDE
jgi:hypothetical protein